MLASSPTEHSGSHPYAPDCPCHSCVRESECRRQRAASHQPCVCPEFWTTLHCGEADCPYIIGGKAAQCYECGGCKAHRLVAEGLADLNGFSPLAIAALGA